LQLVVAVTEAKVEKLRREQPHLHSELCEIIGRLQRAKTRLVALPEAYTFDGALSEILSLVDFAMQEVHESLRVIPNRRSTRPSFASSPEADQALVRAFAAQQDSDSSSRRIIVPGDFAV
jgi:hypothetical protein